MTKWTVVFKTQEGNPLPEFTITDEAVFCLGFMASVIPNGWEVVSVDFAKD